MSEVKIDITEENKPVTAYVVIVTKDDVVVTDSFIAKNKNLNLSDIIPMKKKAEATDIMYSTAVLARKFTAAYKQVQEEQSNEKDLSSDGPQTT